MLNKKTLFSIVYAVALFGAITSCIGILNELLNLAQLYDKGVGNLLKHYIEEDFWLPFVYYFVAFILCAITVTILILYVMNVLKEKHIWILNACIIVTCVIILALSLTIINPLQYFDQYSQMYHLSYYEYLTIYSFRSGIMSFIAAAGTILLCNIIQSKVQKKDIDNSTDEEPKEQIGK